MRFFECFASISHWLRREISPTKKAPGLMSTFGFPSAPQAAQTTHNPNKDIELTSPPTDSISSLCWSPTANHLIATSWDNQIRCWEVQANGASVPKAATAHDQPVLCSAWSPDGSAVFSGMFCIMLMGIQECMEETISRNHIKHAWRRLSAASP